jgi:hypothetical protein
MSDDIERIIAQLRRAALIDIECDEVTLVRGTTLLRVLNHIAALEAERDAAHDRLRLAGITVARSES